MSKNKIILNTSYGIWIFFKQVFVREYLKINKDDKKLFNVAQIWSSWNSKEKIYKYTWKRDNENLISFIEERLEYEYSILKNNTANSSLSDISGISYFNWDLDSWFIEWFDGLPWVEIVEVSNIDNYQIINYDGAECLSPKWLIWKCSILFENKL